MLCLLGVLWGGSFTTVGFAVSALPPLTVATGRIVIGALALIAAAHAIGPGLPSLTSAHGRAVWRSALGVAIATNVLPFSLLAWAQQHIASSLAGVFMAALPLIILPMAHVLIPGERMTWTKTLGVAVGFAGVLTLFGGGVLAQLGGEGWEVLAQLACLGAATGYATGSIITKRSPPAHPIGFSAASLGLAALILTPIAFAVEAPWSAPWTPGAAAAVIGLGLFPTGLAMVMLFLVIQRAGPSFLSLVNYQIPVWAMLFGALILGETIPARAAIALVLILFGVAVSQGLLSPRRRAAGEPAE